MIPRVSRGIPDEFVTYWCENKKIVKNRNWRITFPPISISVAQVQQMEVEPGIYPHQYLFHTYRKSFSVAKGQLRDNRERVYLQRIRTLNQCNIARRAHYVQRNTRRYCSHCTERNIKG